jgi:hypothetical protein
MISLSDRRHDAFDNPAKMACRAGNLRVLREAAFLLWDDADRTRLRCDWCELMGETGFLTLDLIEREGVLAPGGFVGIDLDLERIDGFRQRRPDLKWVAGNFYERLDAPELANVGILNLDEYGEVGNRCATVDFPLIRGLVQRGLETFGEFALFWNQDLDAVVRRRRDRGPAPPRGHGVRSPPRLPSPARANLGDVTSRRERSGNRFRVRGRARRLRDLPRFRWRAPDG